MGRTLDKGLILSTLFLLGLGLVQVYSSSYIFAIEAYGDGLYFFRKQALFVIMGLFIIAGTAYFPVRHFKKVSVLLWSAAVIGLILTLFTGLGVKVGGAYRWLQVPLGFRFEPSELLKVTFPLMMAFMFGYSKKEKNYGRQQDQEEVLWVMGAKVFLLMTPLVLLLKQPDFGSFVICTTVMLVTLFAYGLKWRFIFAGLVMVVPAFYFLVIQVPYRYARVVAYLDPWADPSKKGFQVIQSLLSFHSGGLWGKGLGQGQGKLFFLPEAHTDFTMAVLGEELGFLGVAFVILIFGYIVFRGVQIAAQAKGNSDQIVALGVTLTLAFSVFINIGMELGLLPTKGLALPFLSYGGSSLVCTCFAVGILLNIDRKTKSIESFKGFKV